MRAVLSFLLDPRRAGLRLILTWAVAALFFALAGWAWVQERTWPEQSTQPLDDPLANLKQLGVNVDLAQIAPAQRADVLAKAQAAGLRWVRQRFPWDQIEPQQGTFAWEPWDEIVTACAAHDIPLIAVLDGAPAWARPEAADAGSLTPPRQVADWGRFVAQFAARYRGQIAAYQLWDEPNLAAHWGGRYVDAVAYLALLREGAIQVRQADPGRPVLLAALAPTTEGGPLNLDEVSYLQQLVTADGRPFFDAIALQPYGFAQPPSASGGAARLDFGRAAWVRREMVRLGLSDVPVWATAWGWSAPPPGGELGPWPTVPEAQQAQYTLDAVRIARREWPWMGPMILYTLQPDLPPQDPRWGFALLDGQGTPTPLCERLVQYAATAPPLGVGHYLPGEAGARYSGDWRFSDAGADPPPGANVDERNAVVAFDFEGAGLDVTVRRGDFWGVLYVAVDGKPAHGLPRDEEGQSYVVLYDPQDGTEQIAVARGLSTRVAHHVEIVAHGGWGQWPLAGWTVYGPPGARVGAGKLALFLLAGIVGALAGIGQIVAAPGLLDPLYRLAGSAFRWYRRQPEWLPVTATLATATAFYLAPWWPLSLLLLALLFVLFFLRLDLGLATVALALPFYLEPKPLLGRPFSVVEIGLGLCTLAWATARLLDAGRAAAHSGPQPLYVRLQRWDAYLQTLPGTLWRRWTARPEVGGLEPADKGMAGLLLVAALALTWSARRDVAVREFRTLFLESALFYALIRLALRSARAHWRLVEGWLLGATLIAVVGILQAIAGESLISAEGVWRVRGLYGSPNNLALYLERAWPVLLALAWQGASGSKRRLPCGLAALAVSVALLLTLSRGALLLALPAALLALGFLQRRRRALWIAVAAVAVLALILLPLVLTGRFRSLLDWSQGTAFFRLKLWRSAVAMIADHPMTGLGLDQFLYAYRSRYVLPSAWQELNLSHPHNLLLDTWIRLGIGGVVVAGWLLVSFFRGATRQFQRATGDRRALLLGLQAAAIAALAHGMVDQSAYLVDLAFVWALWIALATSEPRG